MQAQRKPHGPHEETRMTSAPQGSEVRPGLVVTVVGAGTMGGAMAARLLDRGMHVAVWSRHPESNSDLVEHGAVVFADVTEAVAKADVVITMLPTADVTRPTGTTTWRNAPSSRRPSVTTPTWKSTRCGSCTGARASRGRSSMRS